MQLQEVPETPVHSRGTPSFTPQLKKDPVFPLLNFRGGSIPLLRRERNPDVAVAPQEEASLTLKLECIPGSRASIQKGPDFPIHYR